MGSKCFNNRIIPSTGIVHQVNLEYFEEVILLDNELGEFLDA